MLNRYTLLTLFYLYAFGAKAQQTSSQIWNELMFNIPFAKVYNLEIAPTYSTVLELPKWRCIELQGTLERSMSKQLDLMAAILVGSTFQSETKSTYELREMIGSRIHFTPTKRLSTRLLLRLEQRNLFDRENETWENSHRARVRFETLLPFNQKSLNVERDVLYGIADVEGFLVFDQNVNERFANRFRWRTGLGYKVNNDIRFEFIYTLQVSKNTLQGGFESLDHIFRFRMKYYLNQGH